MRALPHAARVLLCSLLFQDARLRKLQGGQRVTASDVMRYLSEQYNMVPSDATMQAARMTTGSDHTRRLETATRRAKFNVNVVMDLQEDLIKKLSGEAAQLEAAEVLEAAADLEFTPLLKMGKLLEAMRELRVCNC